MTPPPRARATHARCKPTWWTLSIALFACGCSSSGEGDGGDPNDPSSDTPGDGTSTMSGDPDSPGATTDGDGTPGTNPSGTGPDGTPAVPDPDADPNSNGTDPDDSTSSDPGMEDPTDAEATESTPVDGFVRLTRAEYAATILAALGATPDVNAIPEDGRIGPFTSNASVNPDPVHPYMLVAESIAQETIPGRFPACDADAVTECLENEYRAPIEQLLRRSLSESEISSWAQMITELQASGATPEASTRTFLASVLISPDFLFRSSPSSAGEDAQTRRLAERLSYALWDAPPDAELREAMTAAGTDVATVLRAQSSRLAGDVRARTAIARFLAQWLDVDTDLRLEEPAFETSPGYLELLAVVDDAFQNETPVTAFISGDRGFVHEDNPEAYQLDGVDEPNDLGVATVTWPATSARRGLLGQELFAASTRHPDATRRPIFRGLLVRRALLCNTIPPPTADLIALAGEVGERTEDPRCASCHQLLDPIGRAFAALDEDAEDAPGPAEVVGHAELQGSYDTLPALLEAVAASRAFAECFSRNWLGFFLEQPPNEIDEAWVSRLADAIEAGASLGVVIEESSAELSRRTETGVPWCEGE